MKGRSQSCPNLSAAPQGLAEEQTAMPEDLGASGGEPEAASERRLSVRQRELSSSWTHLRARRAGSDAERFSDREDYLLIETPHDAGRIHRIVPEDYDPGPEPDLQRYLNHRPLPDPCDHYHTVYPGYKLLCRLVEKGKFVAFSVCPAEETRFWTTREQLYTDHPLNEVYPGCCIICRDDQEANFPLLWYCCCQRAAKIHPECLTRMRHQLSNFYHRCTKCDCMFIGTRSCAPYWPANLVIQILLDGRKIFITDSFHPLTPFGFILTLLRRLHFIAYVPEVTLNKSRVNSNPGWWHAPLNISGDRNWLIVRVPDYLPGFSVAVFHKFKTYIAKHANLYSVFKDKRTWIQDWEAIRRDTIDSLVNNYTDLKRDEVALTLYQQTATFVWKDEAQGEVRRQCVRVMSADGTDCFEDLDTGEVVKGGELEKLVLEFLSSGCGYFLPKSMKPGVFACTNSEFFIMKDDGRLYNLTQRDVCHPDYVLMLFGFMKIVGGLKYVYYSLDDNVVEEIYPHTTQVGGCDTGLLTRPTPDMVRVYIFFWNGQHLPRIVTPCRRKLLLYRRCGFDVRVEDGVLVKEAGHSSERWGCRWTRQTTASYLHVCVTRSMTACLCHTEQFVPSNARKGID